MRVRARGAAGDAVDDAEVDKGSSFLPSLPSCRHAVLLAPLLLLLLLVLQAVAQQPQPSPLSLRATTSAAAAVAQPPLPPRFLRYIPSALEAEWTANIKEWQQGICSRLGGAPGSARAVVQRLLDALDQQHYEGAGLPVGAGARALDALEADGLLSIMEYSHAGSVVRVRMMPLVGMLRDPRVSCPPHAYGTGPFTELRGVDMYKEWQIQSRMFLFLDPRAAALHSGSRAVLLDLGASTWNHQAGSRWVSQRLEQQGVRFEHVWAWEARSVEPRDFFKGADASQLAALHFYNWPVSAEPGAPDNPWTLLAANAAPSDHVVVKLDIDTEQIDNPLARQVLEDPALLARVDDFFFEMHFSNPDMDWLWKNDGFSSTVADTYALFSQLRHKGVRANPWP